MQKKKIRVNAVGEYELLTEEDTETRPWLPGLEPGPRDRLRHDVAESPAPRIWVEVVPLVLAEPRHASRFAAERGLVYSLWHTFGHDVECRPFETGGCTEACDARTEAQAHVPGGHDLDCNPDGIGGCSEACKKRARARSLMPEGHLEIPYWKIAAAAGDHRALERNSLRKLGNRVREETIRRSEAGTARELRRLRPIAKAIGSLEVLDEEVAQHRAITGA